MTPNFAVRLLVLSALAFAALGTASIIWAIWTMGSQASLQATATFVVLAIASIFAAAAVDS